MGRESCGRDAGDVVPLEIRDPSGPWVRKSVSP